MAAGDKVVLTSEQDTAFDDGKRWIRNLIDAATSAFDGDDKKLDGYTSSTKVGRSVPRLLERLKGLSERAMADATALAAEGFDAAEVAQGPAIHEGLAGADGAQEAAIKDLPTKTRDMYAKKGELYLLLKNCERAARRTWRDDPTRVGTFALSLLKRGGSTRAAPAPNG